MSCFDSRASLVPQGFGYVGASNSSVGPTPYCPPGASKYSCGRTCCNRNDDASKCKTCNFYETPPLLAAERDAKATPMPDPADEGWTEIGIAVGADWAPQIEYLTKSCEHCDVYPFRSSAQCNGCQTDAALPYLDATMDGQAMGAVDDGTTGVPARYRPGGNPWRAQRAQNAYERKTMWTNYGIGVGLSQPQCSCDPLDKPGAMTSNGMRYGKLHAGGCKNNRCNQDPFYHPAVSVATAPMRKYRLYAKPTQCGSSRWQFAVAPYGVQNPLFTTLPADPRQPPWSTCATVGFHGQALVQIKSGDRIYVPGQPGTFLVNLYVDNVIGPYRANASVFRGYSPVRPLRGKVFTANSGLRNFTSHPSANGLLRPF
jgi:hypothetical protein